MKKLILILILQFGVLSASDAQLFRLGKPKLKPKPAPAPVAEEIQKPESNTSIQQARQAIRELNIELTSARTENEKLKLNLEDASRRIVVAEQGTLNVQKQADALREWGIIQQAESHRFIERYNNAVKRYHRLKIIAAVIAGLGGILFGMQFMALTPPPYNLFTPVLFSGTFAALVWFFL
jgi:hypothetical protein